MPTDIEVLCPNCGNADIRERNVAYAVLPVLAWTRDKDGRVVPEEYDTDVGADWEAEDVSDQYVCYRCHHRMTLDQLTDLATPEPRAR
jgi:hypothetical protein